MLPFLRTIGVAALTAGALAAAAAPASAGHSRSNATTFATATGSDVVVFNTDGRAAQVKLRGIGYGEKIRGLDVRPSTGVLYAVTDADRIYTIDLKARRAMPAGPAFMPPTLGEYGGFDFNPVPDKIRLTTDANENRRIEPANGATLAIDKPLAFAATDANVGVDPAVVGSGYTNPDNDPATATTLYGIDAATDSLVKQDPPNDGVLTTVGTLGLNVGAYKAGFDVAPGNTGWALLRPRGGKPGLYKVDLDTGAAKRVLSLRWDRKPDGLAVLGS